METISHYVGTEELAVVTCWCGCRHAVPLSLQHLRSNQRDNKLTQTAIFCPLGHEHIMGTNTKLDDMTAALARERATHDQDRAALRAVEGTLDRISAAHNRLRKRIAAGICPCCHRTVSQLSRHMISKHPGYSK